MSETRQQIVWFAIAGLTGFVVDYLLLLWFVQAMALEPLAARVVSFLAAATTTWLINRRKTFAHFHADAGLFREWSSYLGLMLIGGALNLFVFSLIIGKLGDAPRALLVGVVLGTAVGMVANYLLARFALFRHRR